MSETTLITALETILTELRIRRAATVSEPVPPLVVSHDDLMAVLVAHTARFDRMDHDIKDLRRFILSPSRSAAEVAEAAEPPE